MKTRLSVSEAEDLCRALQGTGQTEAGFLREALREKLACQEREKRFEERYIESLNHVERRLSGLSSMLRLIFSGLTTLAATFFRYFREPARMSWQENERNLNQRLRAFQKSLVEQYNGEIGREFDGLAEEPFGRRNAEPKAER